MDKRMRVENSGIQAVDGGPVVKRRAWRSNPRLTVLDISRATLSASIQVTADEGASTFS